MDFKMLVFVYNLTVVPFFHMIVILYIYIIQEYFYSKLYFLASVHVLFQLKQQHKTKDIYFIKLKTTSIGYSSA